MEVMEAIRERRAVREFSERLVERADIERLIGAAVAAPSAMNLQPWAFAVLSGRERLAQLGAQAKSWAKDNMDPEGREPRLRAMIEDVQFKFFYNAPALVLVCATSRESQAIEDCCLAAQNLMLAARNLELGTCWIGLARPWLDLPATDRKSTSLNSSH